MFPPSPSLTLSPLTPPPMDVQIESSHVGTPVSREPLESFPASSSLSVIAERSATLAPAPSFTRKRRRGSIPQQAQAREDLQQQLQDILSRLDTLESPQVKPSARETSSKSPRTPCAISREQVSSIVKRTLPTCS